MTPRQSPFVSALSLMALACLVAAFFAPMWWVSLTAPNYPADAFPDGIKILFGFEGVSNGCTTVPKQSQHAQETQQEDLGWRENTGAIEQTNDKPAVLDCMHEMNTINHYVGMHPIGVGAPVERLTSRYIVALFAVMLLAFAVPVRRARLAILGLGFVAVAGWLFTELYGMGRLDTFVAQYVEDAGKYFREADRIARWAENLRHSVLIVALVLTAVMALIFGLVWKSERAQLLLVGIPALMPAYFVGAFAAWLYFFGHNLHPWGAFTVKPFMPTVFGDGKVAQFTTHSYPMVGFAWLAASAVLLLVALVRRRLELAAQK